LSQAFCSFTPKKQEDLSIRQLAVAWHSNSGLEVQYWQGLLGSHFVLKLQIVQISQILQYSPYQYHHVTPEHDQGQCNSDCQTVVNVDFYCGSTKQNLWTCRVSREQCAILREGVPYVKVCRYNPKHLCPKLNGYGDNGQRSLKLWQVLHTCWLPNTY
jgi:hypothetical protein